MTTIGYPFECIDEATSTNDLVKARAVSGAAEGLVIAARLQTQGRGRRGRVWSANRDESVLMSALIRPGWPESDAPWLGALAAVAAAETVQEFGVKRVTVKWPNDVLVDGRKIAGVLVEPRLDKGRIEFAVLGVGLNVRQQEADFPEDLRGTATSLRRLGLDVAVGTVLAALVRRLDEAYAKARASGIESVVSSWTAWTGSDRQPVLE